MDYFNNLNHVNPGLISLDTDPGICYNIRMTKNPIYSKSGNFLIVVDAESKEMYAARVFRKIRSYWEPVTAETNMSPKRFEEFVNG